MDAKEISGSKTETNKKEEFCNIKLETLLELKDSTKKLLCLINDLQKKSSHAKPIPSAITEEDLTIPILTELTNHIEDLPETSSLKQLEEKIKGIDEVELKTVHECTVYERLTRKCNCLNRTEFNDLIIHFNDETKYITSDLGEIIKNIRVVKKFLYMGGGYTKNALIFLNEGLTKCPHSERVDILLALSHADLCNVFDDQSFVKMLITVPLKIDTIADSMQALAARVLYRIAVVEEGRRYLNFNSKISNDMKQVLKRGTSRLNVDTVDFLNSTINLLNPSTVPLINSSYYCKAQEGVAKKILNSLQYFREYMTSEEVSLNLDLMNKLCDTNKGLCDMRQNLTCACTLFKSLLLEYNSSEMNVKITSIMNKLTRGKIIKRNTVLDAPKSYVVSDTATEPTEMKDKLNQAPSHSLLKNIKKNVKSRLGIYMRSNNRSFKKRPTGGYSERELNRVSNRSNITRNFSLYT